MGTNRTDRHSVRVDDQLRLTLKLASARLDCSICEVLRRVIAGEAIAIAELQRSRRDADHSLAEST